MKKLKLGLAFAFALAVMALQTAGAAWLTWDMSFKSGTVKVIYPDMLQSYTNRISWVITMADRSLVTTNPLHQNVSGFIQPGDALVVTPSELLWFDCTAEVRITVNGGGGQLRGYWGLNQSADNYLNFRRIVNAYNCSPNLLHPGYNDDGGQGSGLSFLGNYLQNIDDGFTWGIEHETNEVATGVTGTLITDGGKYSGDGVFVQFQGLIANSYDPTNLAAHGLDSYYDTDCRTNVEGRCQYTLTYRIPSNAYEWRQEISLDVLTNNWGPVSTAVMSDNFAGYDGKDITYASDSELTGSYLVADPSSYFTDTNYLLNFYTRPWVVLPQHAMSSGVGLGMFRSTGVPGDAPFIDVQLINFSSTFTNTYQLQVLDSRHSDGTRGNIIDFQLFDSNGGGSTRTFSQGTQLSLIMDYVTHWNNAGVSLVSSQNPSELGQSVTFTATVSRPSGSSTPTGNVTFKDGSTNLGTVALNGSVASYTAAAYTAVGTHFITATYNGDTNYNPVMASLTQVVSPPNDIWTGAANNIWDVSTSTNWLDPGNPTVYHDTNDSVQFDDTATGSANVLLNITVAPCGVLVSNVNKDYSFSGAGAITGSYGLIKLGSGTLTINNSNSYTGSTLVQGGTLAYSGSGSSGGSPTNLYVGGINGVGVLYFNSTGTLNFATVSGATPYIGGAGGLGDTGVGAVNQSAGNVTMASSSGTYLTLGAGSATAYGAYTLSGGTLTTPGGAGIRLGYGALGSFVQSGGTLNCGRLFAVGGNNSSGNGVATFLGGTTTINSSYRINIPDNAGTAVLNLGTEGGGNAAVTTLNGTGVTLQNTANGTGTLNLNSGTLVVGGPIYRNNSSGGSATVNFNGGTVRAGANNITLVNNTPTSLNVYNGGAVFDSQGYTVTHSASLLAAAGNGIYPVGGSLVISSNGGSGYVGAPLVTVSTSGSGSNAMAIANVSGGVVTSVTMTCPGQNYAAGDTLTFTFVGGGYTTAADAFDYTLQAGDLAVNNGGLTKLGTGTLTLTGTSSYTGNTMVNAGTLNVAVDSGLGQGNVVVTNGASLILGGGVTNGYIASIANLVLGTGATANLNFTGTNTVNGLSLNGGASYIPVGTYGSSTSSAANKDSHFASTGAGVINVTAQPNGPAPVQGQALLWNAGASTSAAQDGSGVWSTNDVDWLYGTNNWAWNDGNVAVFGVDTTTNCTVTLGNNVTPAGITFNTTGDGSYTIAGGNDIQLTNVTPFVANGDGNISAPISGTGGLSKSGVGTLTLSGANTYSGVTTVNAGAVTYTGSGASSGSSTLNVGGASGKAVLNINTTGALNFQSTQPSIGGAGGATDTGVGAVYQTSGTVQYCGAGNYLSLGVEAPGTQVSGLGSGEGFAYGYYNLSGGTVLTTNSSSNPSGIRIGAGGVGVWYQTGGDVICPRYFVVGGNGTQGGNGVATLTGGTVAASVGQSYSTGLGGKPNASGILNLGTEAGGTAVFTNGATGQVAVNLLSDNNAKNAFLNLNSGALVINNSISRNSGNTGAGNTAAVNCNGGTIQAGSANINNLFVVNSGMPVKFYNGGLTIDSQGLIITNKANLAAAAGNGFYPAGGKLAISSGGAGYIGAPWVNVTNSPGAHGSNAMAIATVSGGTVNNVFITCPGENYQAGDVLNFVFINGGATAPATTFQYTVQSGDLLPNNGGLTKLGSGLLVQSGTNTYTGNTTVSAGTLAVTADGGLGLGNVIVANNATLTLGGGVTNGYIATTANLVLGTSATNNLNFTGTNTVNGLSLDGGLTYAAVGTYGSSTSPAVNQDNAHFTGTGVIKVTAQPAGVTYTLTYNAGTNGTISGITPQTVNYGDSGSAVTAMPNSGYAFTNWSDGLTANPRTDSNVTNDIIVTANFVPVAATQPVIGGAAMSSGNGFSLTATGAVGSVCVMLGATNLAPAVWLPVQTNTADTNGVFHFNDLLATNQLQRFYRLMVR